MCFLVYGQHDRVMDGGLFPEPPALISLLPWGQRGSAFILSLASSVKHNPGSCSTSSVGLHTTNSCYFLKALSHSWGWESLKVAEDSLRDGQEVIQQNEKWFYVAISQNDPSREIWIRITGFTLGTVIPSTVSQPVWASCWQFYSSGVTQHWPGSFRLKAALYLLQIHFCLTKRMQLKVRCEILGVRWEVWHHSHACVLMWNSQQIYSLKVLGTSAEYVKQVV